MFQGFYLRLPTLGFSFNENSTDRLQMELLENAHYSKEMDFSVFKEIRSRGISV
jgi:hypothetical protein